MTIFLYHSVLIEDSTKSFQTNAVCECTVQGNENLDRMYKNVSFFVYIFLLKDAKFSFNGT